VTGGDKTNPPRPLFASGFPEFCCALPEVPCCLDGSAVRTRLIPPVTIAARAGEREFKRDGYDRFIIGRASGNPGFIGVGGFGNLTKRLNRRYGALYHSIKTGIGATN
jgi:hypothetical protein